MSDLTRGIAEGLRLLLEALDRQGIRYVLCGSLASSIHGILRYTRDIDIVAAIGEQHTANLAADLGREFYMDAEALPRGKPITAIHLASSYKFDIFPVPSDPFYQMQLVRSELQPVTFGEEATINCPVATAEDTILAKLVWYRLSGERSDQHWYDLRRIRVVQQERLDQEYMRKWATHLQVADLLDRLMTEEL